MEERGTADSKTKAAGSGPGRIYLSVGAHGASPEIIFKYFVQKKVVNKLKVQPFSPFKVFFINFLT